MLTTRTLSRLSVGAALATAALALPATSLAATPTGIPSLTGQGVVVKPSEVVMLETNVTKIHWSSWTAAHAVGTGTVLPSPEACTNPSLHEPCKAIKSAVIFTRPKVEKCGGKAVKVFTHAYLASDRSSYGLITAGSVCTYMPPLTKAP